MGAPSGELVEVTRPRVVPPSLERPPRARVPRAVRWFGATLATAIGVGGLTLWSLRPTPPLPPAPRAAPSSPAAAAPPPLVGVEALARDTARPALPNLAPPGETSPDWLAEGAALEAELAAPPPARVAADVAVASTERAEGSADVAPPQCVEGEGAGTGTIAVNTHPWSEVTLDGVDLGHTPQMSIRTCAGSHSLTFDNSALGIHEERRVSVVAGEVLALVITLRAGPSRVTPPPPVTVDFTSDPAGATVRIVRSEGGRRLCTTPCTAEVRREGVAWRVEMTRDGFELYDAPLSLPEGVAHVTHAAELRAVCPGDDAACGRGRDRALADTPTPGELRRAMSAVSDAVAACGVYGPAVATAIAVIEGSTGRVTDATVTGDLSVDARECALAAVHEIATPRFRNESFRMTYPLRF